MRKAVVSGLFYGGCTLLYVLITTKTLAEFLPENLATQIGHNSEMLVYAMLVCAALQFLRPRVLESKSAWVLVGVVAAVEMTIGVILYGLIGDIDSTRATLTEAFTAAAVVTVYVCLPRPIRGAVWMAAGLFAFIVVFNRTGFVTDHAEDLVAVMLAPLAFDVFDRRIMEPEVEDRQRLRYGWYLSLLVIPIVFMVLQRQDLTGLADEIQTYGSRPIEAFWGTLLIHMFAAVALVGSNATRSRDSQATIPA